MADFVHLHLHTQYSFLDGAIHMADLCPRVKELGMSAVATTEHGNLFGAIDFYKRAKETGIKAILGCEAYVADKGRHDRTSRRSHHLVLLAKNNEGWRNLMYLVSMGYREGFYYKPRIDKELLKERSKGLIALTACLGGEVASNCLQGNVDQARTAARDLKSIFEPGQFFIELQENGLEEQKIANDHMKQLARDEEIPLIATNDCHYKMKDDAAAHDVLMCIQHSRSRNDPTRQRHHTDAFYIRSPDEMAALFKDCPEAIENTLRVRDMIDLKLELDKPMLPTFVPPDGSDIESYLIDRARKGLEQRFNELTYKFDRDQYKARLEEELRIIISMKFPGYFLIVADFINWAKVHGIPVGPGRGSGAGSIVAYSLRITDLDPIPYNLLFERFLNPERVSMPDFDVDFCQERRGEVIEYVSNKYGATHVGQIATFAQLKAKSVIKDVARVLEVPFSEVNAITKLLPNTYKDDKGNVKPITIEKALSIEPKLRQLQDEKPIYREVIEIARKLEGLFRQAGMHAAGVVIADNPLWDVVPVFRGNDNEIVTQFSMSDVESAGLVKFDFLGLKTLDVIDHAERIVNARIEKELKAKKLEPLFFHPHIRRLSGSKAELERLLANDLLYMGQIGPAAGLAAKDPNDPRKDVALLASHLELADRDTYKLMAKGETLGVFQLESTGFQELLKRLKPDCFEDVVAAVALYRPGPLQTGMVDDFIDCKHGRKKVKYPHPLLEKVLKPTYGGFVYQEQVMQAAQVMGGYSLGGADLLRRAMGKKKAEVMAKERSKFVGGCVAQKIDEKHAGEVFDLMEKFAGYGFNKSHSAAYALVTFQTAYLKNYYPVEFMAALLTTEASSTDNIVKYIAEAKSMGIAVLPPTVNESEISFTVSEGKIRFGLGAIKGLGEGTLGAILEARKEKGAFHSIYDFCERVPLKQLNKKTLEALVHSGAFDGFGRPRAQLFGGLDHAIDAAKSTQHDKAIGQASLFGSGALAAAVRPREKYDETQREWPETERLKFEKEAIGFYVTGHPLDRYKEDMRRLANATIAHLDRKGNRAEVVLCAVVSAMRERPLKDGSGRMAFVVIEDLTGSVEMMVSAHAFSQFEMTLKSDQPLIVKAQVTIERDDEAEAQTLKLRCLEVKLLSDARKDRTKLVELSIEETAVDKPRLQALKKVLGDFPGACPVRLLVRIPSTAEVEMVLPDAVKVEASDAFVDRVESIFGMRTVRFA